MSHKYSKKEIKEIMNSMEKYFLICRKGFEEERFKQIIVDGKYIPYLISTCGRVISLNKNNNSHANPKELKTHYNKNGYKQIRITYNKKKRTYLIHALVAKAFVKKSSKKKNMVVNHIDGSKDNNIYTNLEWVTHSENTRHAIKHGLFKPRKGEQVGTSKYSEKDIIKICELITQNYSSADICKITNVSYHVVKNVFLKQAWRHISDNYDFSNYMYGKDKDWYLRIHELCKLASEGDYTTLHLEKLTGINRRTIYDILKGKTHKKISSQYNLEKYRK